MSSVGRYPFMTYGDRYLDKRTPYLAPITVTEMRRKIHYLSKLLVRLTAEGVVKTHNPKKMDHDDVAHLMRWLLDQEYERAYICKLLGYVEAVSEYAGNNVFARMRAEGEEFPTRGVKELNALSDAEMKELMSKVDRLKGWEGAIKRLFVYMYPATGLRPSELRKAHVTDIDTRNWTIYVRHPKGEKRYARRRTAPILPFARPVVKAYLDQRAQRLQQYGVESEYLVCNKDGELYSDTAFRNLKADIQGTTDIMFHLKSFRDKYCQINIDRDPSKISAVSATMGHATTRTTEQSYGRIKLDRAVTDVQNLWHDDEKNKNDEPDVKNPSINHRYDNTGYA